MADKEKMTIPLHQALNDLGFKGMWYWRVRELQSGPSCIQVSSHFKKQHWTRSPHSRISFQLFMHPFSQPSSCGAPFPLHMCGYLTPLPSLFIYMGDNTAALYLCDDRGRERERALQKEQADSLRGLHAQWRGDDVEPWRKCPHLRQSSCACPSRLAAQDHPFKHPSTPCSSARLSPHILLLWGMGYDTSLGYLPLLSLVTEEALLLMF